MSTDLSAPPDPRAIDPFFYGYRYVTATAADGKQRIEQVPLSEWDVLHPEEGDFIMQDNLHNLICAYLWMAFRAAVMDRMGVKVYSDLRILWNEKLGAYGPDVVAFENLPVDIPDQMGTLYAADVGALPLIVVEVVSNATRGVDYEPKLDGYHAAGVPVYVIVDPLQGDGLAISCYEYADEGYVESAPAGELGYWLPAVGLWIRAEGNRAVCHNRLGERILENEDAVREHARIRRERNEANERADREAMRADREKARADEEEARAKREKARADEEKARADEAIDLATSTARERDEATALAKQAAKERDAAAVRAEQASKERDAAAIERDDAEARVKSLDAQLRELSAHRPHEDSP